MKAIFISVLLLSACIATAQKKEVLVVHFDFDKYGLTEQAKAQIDSFFSVQQSAKYIKKVELAGHCDFMGSDGYNDVLSTQRVNKVKELLQTRDYVKRDIIKAVAYGEKQPLNENRTDEDRQLNRRVEITLTIVIPKIIKDDEVLIQEPPVKLKEQIADSSIISGTNIVLRNINFYGGMHRLIRESSPMLQELLDAMNAYPKLVIEIQGHICCENRPGDGMDRETGIYNLSTARAKAIYDYLVENGVQASRVSFRGFGHTQPLFPYPEQNEEQRVANRRVEIKIISK